MLLWYAVLARYGWGGGSYEVKKKLLEIRNQELFGTRNTSCTIAYLIQEDVIMFA